MGNNANNNPLISFLLFTYNQEKYVNDALRGVYNQDYDNLEIIISDDASTDRTYDLIQDFVKREVCRHKIYVNRNNVNLGLTRHINKIFSIANGQIFITAAGDDVSDYNRASELCSAYLDNQESTLFITGAMQIDEDGKVVKENFYDYDLAPRSIESLNDAWILGAVNAYHRRVFDFFGELLPGGVYEDVALVRRSLLLGKVSIIDKPIIKYRVHSGSVSRTMSCDQGMYLKKLKNRQISNLQMMLDNYTYNEKTNNHGYDHVKRYEEIASRIVSFQCMYDLECGCIRNIPKNIIKSTFVMRVSIVMKIILKRINNWCK